MKRICPECHGTGESCYFKGESRFVLSHQECSACCGLGYVESEEEPDASDAGKGNADTPPDQDNSR